MRIRVIYRLLCTTRTRQVAALKYCKSSYLIKTYEWRKFQVSSACRPWDLRIDAPPPVLLKDKHTSKTQNCRQINNIHIYISKVNKVLKVNMVVEKSLSDHNKWLHYSSNVTFLSRSTVSCRTLSKKKFIQIRITNVNYIWYFIGKIFSEGAVPTDKYLTHF